MKDVSIKSKKFSDWFEDLTSEAFLYDKYENKIFDEEQLLNGMKIEKIKYNTKHAKKELYNLLNNIDKYHSLGTFCGYVKIVNGEDIYLYMPYADLFKQYLFKHDEDDDTIKLNHEYNEDDKCTEKDLFKINKIENQLEHVIEITAHSSYSTNIKDLYEASKLRKCKIYNSIERFLSYIFDHAYLYDESNMVITSLDKILCGECKVSKIKICDGDMSEDAKTVVTDSIDKLLKYGVGFNNKIKMIFVNKEN